MLDFAAGQNSRTVPISILTDDVVEDREVFDVILSSPSAGVTLGDDTAVVNIIDATGR